MAVEPLANRQSGPRKAASHDATHALLVRHAIGSTQHTHTLATRRDAEPSKQPRSQRLPENPGQHTHLAPSSPCKQTPRAEQPPMQVGREQSLPDQPSAHRQLPSVQTPCPRVSPQSSTHPLPEQSTPPNPGKHAHTPTARQLPWPSHSLAHLLDSQAAPDQPVSQMQLPSAPQLPWPEHPAGHAGIAQSMPRHPALHTQRLPPAVEMAASAATSPSVIPMPIRATQRPWAVQFGHRSSSRIAQPLPPQPRMHTHARRRVSHHPRLAPPHSNLPRLAQPGRSHMGPPHPSAHAHLPLVPHTPCEEQLAAHMRMLQSAPVQGGSQIHTP